jgi:1-aminocyclopropane-1-carboxylate deaminase/D-cysteine desulfhydrase-like pyridoxal-dependent ACC family enzyme
MKELSYEAVTVDTLNLPVLFEKKIHASMLRLDKIHPQLSGNKLFKLKYYLQDAITLGKQTILTFGGPYSNHIIATAAACNLNGLASIGVIRGEKAINLSPTLKSAEKLGMKLYFINREHYKTKELPNDILDDEGINNIYIINEGGFGEKGVQGATEILMCCRKELYTHICCAVGTGTMLAGLVSASLPGQHITGISVLKNNYETENKVKQLLGINTCKDNFHILHDYHFGGYAKQSWELISFMNEFYETTGIPTDFVYTGKLMCAVHDLVQKGYFPVGSNILIIHSGGLQGNDSLEAGTLMF